MLVKCETKSNRVKCLSFHPKLPWILSSLHNGIIQLWDYRIGSLIDKFEKHQGPVRGLDFHVTQPLFVSGGDDYQLNVWDYRQRKCLFTLIGHLDYIRTVQFHTNYPWILSSSDDQTIRIWNWQSRNCIAVLTGHNHYVMCARFHPNLDYLASASLDQTIRMWDISGLREKTVLSHSSNFLNSNINDNHIFSQNDDNSESTDINHILSSSSAIIKNTTGGIISTKKLASSFSHLKAGKNALSCHGNSGTGIGSISSPSHHADMFGTSDAVCRYILEGHDRGVNWVSFHPTLPFIVSGADDRLIKIWRYNEVKAWEVDTLRGHFNNISCVIFHPRDDFIISNSEDHTIRIWDMSRRILLNTFKRENDRFWYLAAQANSNLLAVGHDSGMVVFKLKKERPPLYCIKDYLFHVKDKHIQLYNIHEDTSINISAIRSAQNALSDSPISIQFNPFNSNDINLLVAYDSENILFDVIICTDCFKTDGTMTSASSTITRTASNWSCAVFISRNRIAAVEKSNNSTINIYNQNIELTKSVETSFSISALFEATANSVILQCDERAILFDLSHKKVINEIYCGGASFKNCIWNNNRKFVAIISKHNIIFANSRFDYIYSLHENIRIKNGSWSDNDALFYSTLSHIKYCLTNGDSGIIHSLLEPIYIFKVANQKIYFFDRKNNLTANSIKCPEYKFKLELQRKNFSSVKSYIQSGKLCGGVIIANLKKIGYPELALQFAHHPKLRFSIAIEYGNIPDAFVFAEKIDDNKTWNALGLAAIRFGHYKIAEKALQKVRNYEKLSFLYLISGNTTKLKKMSQLLLFRKDYASQFHTSLMLGSIEDRIQLLEDCGQFNLAAMMVDLHGISDMTQNLKESDKNIKCTFMEKVQPKLFVPPIVIHAINDENFIDWKHKLLTRDKINSSLTDLSNDKAEFSSPRDSISTDIDQLNSPEGCETYPLDRKLAKNDDKLDAVIWDTDEIDILPGKSTQESEIKVTDNSNNAGTSPMEFWLSNQQSLVPFLIIAGEFDEALLVLKRRIGLSNALPLKKFFNRLYQASWCCLHSMPQGLNIRLPILTEKSSLVKSNHYPHNYIDLESINNEMDVAYKYVTIGRFSEALQKFMETIQCITLALCSNSEEEKQLFNTIDVCREYITAMRLECQRLTLADDDIKRKLELVSYFTCCNLQPHHLFLVLRRAMTIAFKAGNYITTTSFARRLINGDFEKTTGNVEEIEKAKKVLIFSENKGVDAYDIEYDPLDHENFKICCISLCRLSTNDSVVKCPYCGTAAKKEFSGQICPTCDLSRLNTKAMRPQFKMI